MLLCYQLLKEIKVRLLKTIEVYGSYTYAGTIKTVEKRGSDVGFLIGHGAWYPLEKGEYEEIAEVPQVQSMTSEQKDREIKRWMDICLEQEELLIKKALQEERDLNDIQAQLAMVHRLEIRVEKLKEALLSFPLQHTRGCTYDNVNGDEGEFCTCKLAHRRKLYNEALGNS